MLWSRKNIKYDDNIYDWRKFDQWRRDSAPDANNRINALLREGKENGNELLKPLQRVRTILNACKLLPNVVSVISFKGGVGKTTYICNLALNLVRQGARVLIIDGDVGMPDVSLALNQKIAVAGKLFHYCYDASQQDYLLDVYNLTGGGGGISSQRPRAGRQSDQAGRGLL